jgi:uncharacterized ferritin-like protein (DUF455 family)
MELRDFAEQILFAGTLEEKLRAPPAITDRHPGQSIGPPNMPGRPTELRFKAPQAGKASIPGLPDLEKQEPRGRLLHFFANHELLATELMALVLLRFPDAPPAFRRGVLQTLQQEQQHTRWYMRRMEECGTRFGDFPVSGYFWRAISPMQNPLDYVAGLSLTFEQANLDFAQLFSHSFAKVGDAETASLLDRIYHDEIQHVAYGLNWFRRWKNPEQSDWEAFCGQLKFPLSAQRAKGPVFNIEGRLAAGLDQDFIDQLNVYAHSKGRTPGVYRFNPFAEAFIASGKAFTPNQSQRQLHQDLEALPQFLCRQDDIVLVSKRPATDFLGNLKAFGFVVPEFVELKSDQIATNAPLRSRKLGALRPWAWGPDSLELFSPLFQNVTIGSREPGSYYHERIATLYSKEWSAALLRRLIEQWNQKGAGSSLSRGSANLGARATLRWLCDSAEIGAAASTFEGALAQIQAIRRRGHHPIVIKEAIGMAGHNSIRLLEPELLENQRRWIALAIEKGRQLVIEPWLERQLDFSVQFEMGKSGLKLLGFTGLLNDFKGQYRGNWVWPKSHQRLPPAVDRFFPQIPDIAGHIRRLYEDIRPVLETELGQVKYLGPLGIDAFVYRAAEGECRLKPIVEINPRYTMGRLTLELMKNVVPGRTGTFRLINRKQVESEGFQDFSSWAQDVSLRFPTRVEGEPRPKLSAGVICLNDPDLAQACLAIFKVGQEFDSAV